MNSVLKVFAIASLIVVPVASFAADGAEALQRHHERNKQRFNEIEMRVQSKKAIETDKPVVSQEENKSSGEVEEANARAAKEAG
ncbi:hypothetical protein JFT91_18075 [Pseudomonas sp. TH08]|uniref:hypothetical protein n=1 Tax=unclassified Pseudomonas TaxID=196821 RepID=UPI0019127FE7|nr:MULTISPECIES: hypothetical protein [unclassified Pseudomonas]MBK5512117.1 hypothetical protein [Pseudomonas sp. TH15]MBK5534478.1 hypothetical protein [Pseudomonas sp. TH08]